MYFNRKLKSQKIGMEWLPALVALPAMLIIIVTWGIQAAWGAIAIVEFPVVLMHLNNYSRTRNSSFLALAGAFLIIVMVAVYIFFNGMPKHDPGQSAVIIILACTILVIGFIVFTKKIKWRTRELLELAAMPVNENRDGYTDRPMPVSRINATVPEIDAFTRFVTRNLIAIPYRESGGTIYSLTSSYWKQNGLKRGYEDETWVSFSGEGDVNVFISQEDYLKFRDAYTFDQLCHALGGLFIEFFELYRKGEGVRIFDKLNALRLNPITE